IGFILGPLFEDNLRRSLLISHGDPSILWSTPICWFFIALTVFSIYITVKNNNPRLKEG
ncbi:MAG TPA: C4-dicarboxylate ABC transporter permease, partial [Candidatus Avidesulfovibrio excrementigallinarum]|nr:C4-dicarboxylate ABC transporter permease [Candidatus Avidesulfovibrio excrementigallinarum]